MAQLAINTKHSLRQNIARLHGVTLAAGAQLEMGLYETASRASCGVIKGLPWRVTSFKGEVAAGSDVVTTAPHVDYGKPIKIYPPLNNALHTLGPNAFSALCWIITCRELAERYGAGGNTNSANKLALSAKRMEWVFHTMCGDSARVILQGFGIR